MIGSRLLGQQPTFGGADFGIPEIALFGYYQFRSAVPTSDSWEVHDGVEILFMQSGEACWDLPDDHFSMATGSQAVIIPAGQRHRISNGVYTPCRLLWMVFQPIKQACGTARLFLDSEIEALFVMANEQQRPIDLPEQLYRTLGELCSRLTDERLMIGSAPIMAEVRSRLYSSVTSLWEACSSGRSTGAQSRLVRQAAALLRDSAESDIGDKDDSIEDVARQLGYGKSRLYSLFTREVGMAPNDYRQRVRIKRCCERLTKTSESVTAIGIDSGFHSSQYFSRVFKKYVGVTPSDYRRLFHAG
ncbi:helix-turn-helix domain-containing protein [Devosia sp. CN2-171]|jgi:AraC-like DNA-binding protein|uniref:helix-turn-helix transcriptional regulator n=1 Tax=Devosia sp. CN2-171 TaxID=3400909 RepID=UPI003BF86CD8